MNFFIHTTGCRANQWDSYAISNNLQKEGLVESSLSNADIIIINACTLTEGAEKDIRKFVNQIRREKENAKIIIAGCHSQVYPEKSFGADLMLGQTEKFNIIDFLNKTGVFVSQRNSLFLEPCNVDRLPAGKTRFFLKIQDGCNNFCSYCIVPYARGLPRSRPSSEILEAFAALKKIGIREVVLTGIEIASYKDPQSGMGLKELLLILEKSVTPERIRISSIDPLYIDEEFIQIVAESLKIASSFHIPLQSGSDEILKRMKRHYNCTFIMDIVKNINNRIKNAGIGLDVIAGFPGEDDVLFEETCCFIESLPIYYLHVFPFSPREGTAAFSMSEKIPGSVKKQRVKKLKTIDNEKRLSFYRKFINADQIIIPEGKLYRGFFMRGYTDSYMPVYVPFEKSLENKMVIVKIKGIEKGLPIGEIVR